jgi:hypothetical protein
MAGGAHVGAGRGVKPEDYAAGYVQCAVSKAIADVFYYAVQRWCALREEFWCATAAETLDLWNLEYGLPDSCDPFPDLCTKVAAIGGTRCEYYAGIAARAGWSIQCIESRDVCGAFADCVQADCGQTGGPPPFTVLEILVDTSRSPAYVVATRPPPQADSFYADQLLTCPVDLAPLTCVLDRVVHAHVTIAYQIG